ncbi:MAG TPA: hypothetical protein VHA37_02950 [Candidatus Saccharimonadales bacterium]|jgi:hypothetical protein|nr:hypothetical protein [Candidatus Saccharimonadales bacterium]
MSTTLELFERYKQALTLRTDGAAAAALGVKSQTISNWRTRGSQAEPKLIETMCRSLDLDVLPWLLRIQMEQSSDGANKAVWRRVGSRLGYPMACLAVGLTDCLYEILDGICNGMDLASLWNALNSPDLALTTWLAFC